MRAGTLLSSSERVEIEDAATPNNAARGAERWLAVAKSKNCGTLSLSLFYPSTLERTAYSNTGVELNTGAMKSGRAGEDPGSADRVRENVSVPYVKQPRISLSATWKDWVDLGYGPLQWMSHRQKRFFGRLALSWVAIGEQEKADTELPRQSKLGLTTAPSSNAFLQFRPTLATKTRMVGPVTRQEAQRCHTHNLDPSEHASSGSTPQSKRFSADACVSAVMHSRDKNANPIGEVEESHGRKGRVTVADGGRVFTVRIDFEENRKGIVLGEATYFEGTFGIEAWKETSLEELLWLGHCWRQYLARRLSYQVGIPLSS